MQYNVPLRYSGVTVASPPVHKNVMQARSGSARLSMDASGTSDVSAEVSGEGGVPDSSGHTETAADESVQSEDSAVITASSKIVSDIDSSDVTEDTADTDTAVNVQSADTDGGSVSETDVFGLFKRAPLEAVPDGYDGRGNPRIPDSRGLADFRVLSGTGAGKLPRPFRDDEADSVPDRGISGGISDESAGVRGGYPELYDGGDAVNLLKNLAASVDSDDLLITALILMMLAERSGGDESAVDDHVLLMLAFLLLSGNR